jgi:hypothetical protein
MKNAFPAALAVNGESDWAFPMAQVHGLKATGQSMQCT